MVINRPRPDQVHPVGGARRPDQVYPTAERVDNLTTRTSLRWGTQPADSLTVARRSFVKVCSIDVQSGRVPCRFLLCTRASDLTRAPSSGGSWSAVAVGEWTKDGLKILDDACGSFTRRLDICAKNRGPDYPVHDICARSVVQTERAGVAFERHVDTA
jgi:hypothetical protein